MRIQRALLSVSDKTGITKLAAFLHEIGVEIISTGGTMKAIQDAGIPVTYVSDVTGFPEIMDGRVKTLNPFIHGGILAVRSNPDHMAQLKEHGIKPIDLVVVNLYPFREAECDRGGSHREHRYRRPGHGPRVGEEFPRCGYHHQSGPLFQPHRHAAAARRYRPDDPQNPGEGSIPPYFGV